MKTDLKKDLKNIKIAELEEKVFKIIKGWWIEVNKGDRKAFKEEFCSDRYDKEFNDIKLAVGEFVEIKEMRVLDFIAKIVLSNAKEPFFIDLHNKFELKLIEWKNE